RLVRIGSPDLPWRVFQTGLSHLALRHPVKLRGTEAAGEHSGAGAGCFSLLPAPVGAGPGEGKKGGGPDKGQPGGLKSPCLLVSGTGPVAGCPARSFVRRRIRERGALSFGRVDSGLGRARSRMVTSKGMTKEGTHDEVIRLAGLWNLEQWRPLCSCS